MMRQLKNSLPPSVRGHLRTLRATYDPIKRIDQRMERTKFNFLVVHHLREMLRQRRIDLVIDVGANQGQFARFLRREVGYRGRIISFEPVSHTFATLAAAAADDRDWRPVQAAAGTSAGTLPINITRDSVFNSFRAPAEQNLFAQLNQVVTQEQVEVVRLDEWLARDGVGFESAFLKVDTQGYDLEAVRGASGVLDRIAAIQTELSFQPLYRNADSYHAAIGELGSLGYAVSAMFPVTLAGLEAIEFDCLLVRRLGEADAATLTYEQFINEAVHA